MPLRSTRKSKSMTTKAAELAFAVPQVVAHRVTRMALAGAQPSERDRKEFRLMVHEKEVAFTQSLAAMAAQSMRANQALAASFMGALWSPSRRRELSAGAVAVQLHNAALDVLGKGLAPVHRKAVANAKRLARTKLR
jgi:hypothetical protein